jgi:hypothetical protein
MGRSIAEHLLENNVNAAVSELPEAVSIITRVYPIKYKPDIKLSESSSTYLPIIRVLNLFVGSEYTVTGEWEGWLSCSNFP